jgi:hypothetical protein
VAVGAARGDHRRIRDRERLEPVADDRVGAAVEQPPEGRVLDGRLLQRSVREEQNPLGHRGGVLPARAPGDVDGHGAREQNCFPPV